MNAETWCLFHGCFAVACCGGSKDAERGSGSKVVLGEVAINGSGLLPEPFGTAVMAGCQR